MKKKTSPWVMDEEPLGKIMFLIIVFQLINQVRLIS